MGPATPDYADFSPQYRRTKRGEQQVLFLDGYKGVRRNLKGAREPFQIFDLKSDPAEEQDLTASSSKFIALQKKMQEQVLQMRRPSPFAKHPYDSLPIAAVPKRPS